MRAIMPNRPAQVRPYAWAQVRVEPNPPQVGVSTRIIYPLANPEPEPIVVERILTRVAQFGMGVPWEELPAIGPFELPPDSSQIVEAALEWVPQTGGHRCVRAEIHVAGAALPLMVGRNLDVIQADANDTSWRIPFHLGNPEREPAPIMLRMDLLDATGALHAMLRVGGRVQRPDQPVWLRPGEVVAAELELGAESGPVLAARTVIEATIFGRLIDGIQVSLARPASVVTPSRTSQPDMPHAAESLLVACG